MRFLAFEDNLSPRRNRFQLESCERNESSATWVPRQNVVDQEAKLSPGSLPRRLPSGGQVNLWTAQFTKPPREAVQNEI